MEKLHLADLKAKAAKLAKKPKAEDGEAEKEAEAPKSKPIQRPMSKLDREIAAKKAKDEAKEARGPRRRRGVDAPARIGPRWRRLIRRVAYGCLGLGSGPHCLARRRPTGEQRRAVDRQGRPGRLRA